MYLLIFTDLFAYLRVDHCFCDGPGRGIKQTELSDSRLINICVSPNFFAVATVFVLRFFTWL